MRLGRIASPDGVAFVSIDGDADEPGGMMAREIAEHPFGAPTFTGRSWPLADTRLLAPMLASRAGRAAVAISWPTSANRLAAPIPRMVELIQRLLISFS